MTFKKNKKADVNKRHPRLGEGLERPNVFSYHAKRSNELTDSSNTSRVKQLWKLLPTFLGAIVIGVSFLYLISLQTNPAIVLISNTDGSRLLLREPESYEKKAASVMGESIFYGNKLTFNGGNFEKRMAEEFSEFSSVSVSTGLFSRRPVVNAIVRNPAFFMTDLSDQTFLVDMNGEASLPISETAAELRSSLPKLLDKGSEDISQGQAVLTRPETRFIASLVRMLEVSGQDVENLIMPADAHELHVRLEGKPYFVKFNTIDELRVQVGTLLAIQKHLSEKEEEPAEYIDVRVEGRVFYD